MGDNKFKVFSTAKLAIYEILVDQQLDNIGSRPSPFLEDINRGQNRLKWRLIFNKIFGAFIFGVLPVIPLLTYYKIIQTFIENSAPVEVIIFGGCVLYSMYFLIQFFNFFLLGMLNTSLIISGRIFRWFETLPLTRRELQKLLFVTIFRSLDLPIVVILLAFPIMMLIGTMNFFIFILCLGISFLNVLFCFSILILIGETLNRVLDINEISSRKTFIIRIIDILAYVVIIMGSIFLVQWTTSSIDNIFFLFINTENPALINLILSIVAYPLSPSYLVVSSFIPPIIPLPYWINILIGMAIFGVVTWWLASTALGSVDRISTSKFDERIKSKVPETVSSESVKIKTTSPFFAYVRKDLITASREVKIIMTILMPIMISIVFMLTYNLTAIGRDVPIDYLRFYYWFGFLSYQPIISLILVYGLLNMDESGATITAALPINPRDQAKAKIFLLSIIQIIAVFSPLILFLTSPLLFDMFIIILLILPFSMIFLFVTILLRVYFFGKMRYQYVLEEVRINNRALKWVMIPLLNYGIIFSLIASGIFVLAVWDFMSLIYFFLIVFVIGIFFLIILFNFLFPSEKRLLTRRLKYLQEKEKQRIMMNMQPRPYLIDTTSSPAKYNATPASPIRHEISPENKAPPFLCRHVGLSAFILYLLFITFFILSAWATLFIPIDWSYDTENDLYPEVMKLLSIGVFNLCFSILGFLIIPRLLKLPDGRNSFKDYLSTIGIGSIKSVVLVILIAILISILISIWHPLLIEFLGLEDFYPFYFPFINTYIYSLLMYLSFSFWFELVFRGILQTMLLRKYSVLLASLLNSLIISVPLALIYDYYYFPLIYVESVPLVQGVLSLVQFTIVFSLNFLICYVYSKKRNLYLGILILIISFLLGISIMPFMPVPRPYLPF